MLTTVPLFAGDRHRRATLCKYFPDIEAILRAQHQEHAAGHLDRLRALRDQARTPAERWRAVLAGYADICHHRQQHGSEELSALLRRQAPSRPLDVVGRRGADSSLCG